MRRAVALMAVAAALTSCASDSSEPRQFTIGFLRAVEGDHEPVLSELRAAGFVRGENLRFLGGDPAEVHASPEDAEETARTWVEEGVDLILAFSSVGAASAREATSEVPILFLVNDPVAVGLVDDAERPEANLTGVSFRVPADRTIDLARRAVPDLTTLGVLFPPDDPAALPHRDTVLDAAEAAGIAVVAEPFHDEGDVGRALDALVEAGSRAVLVANSPTSVRALGVIQPAAAERAIPLIANTDLAAEAVVVLTPDTDELLSQMGRMAVRLLQGVQPSEIPVEDPRRFQVVLNAGRASALGLPAFSDDLVDEADRVVP